MSVTAARPRPSVDVIPTRGRRRPVCRACGPSFGWERPTATTLALILAMHSYHEATRPRGLRRLAQVLRLA